MIDPDWYKAALEAKAAHYCPACGGRIAVETVLVGDAGAYHPECYPLNTPEILPAD